METPLMPRLLLALKHAPAPALTLLLLIGCADSAPRVEPVSGVVLVDGEPLKYGYIRFIPQHGRASDAEIRDDGAFKLHYSADRQGAVVGMHRIEVAANEVKGSNKVTWHAPPKYASVGTSGLTQEVTGPLDDVVVNLTWSGSKAPRVQTYSAETSL